MPAKEESTEVAFYDRWAGLMIGAGVVGVIVGLVALVTGQLSGMLFLVGSPVGIAIGVSKRRVPVLRMMDAHLEVRLAVLRSAVVVRYDEIETAERNRNWVLVLKLRGQRTVVIPLRLFTQSEREKILSVLAQHAVAGAPVARIS